MDPRWMDRYGHQRNDDSEPEYDVADNLEVHKPHVLARPLTHVTKYADRDLPRSQLAPGLSAVPTSTVNIPPRKYPVNSGPTVNRDLKPGRSQNSHRLSPSPVRDLPGRSLHRPCRNDQRASKTEEFSPPTEDPWRTDETLDPSQTQSHSLNLETCHRQKRPTQRARRVGHLQQERPQSKEEHHDFVPMEEPQQPCYKEEWYVGVCSRVDAEHALHLDGAFLVRNSSMNTNSEPLVLAVYYEKKVYNIKIRFIEESNKYALGTGLRSNDMFDTVTDMIRFHSIFPIILVSGRNVTGSRQPESCVLTCPVTRRDLDLLLQ
ncbi:cytokine-dependent hematopoietic cell linker isoform X2 [Takifugu rubripes]|uniref:cytokine-dependent hematopoietic cell linker isoform X2 n=1 Tax=Takifugu rubripes TaxID=31033 RepID=UPI0005D1BA54|nr:cytokine-dependent hematopoietic cell linker isoform X2 [Takifugu rubripes]|eukprot:XP_011609206.1 PREDICTED: cytokine-dependent hematopoietic cell linker isoform X2 [Takifugu rubripes]